MLDGGDGYRRCSGVLRVRGSVFPGGRCCPLLAGFGAAVSLMQRAVPRALVGTQELAAEQVILRDQLLHGADRAACWGPEP